jgi:hypothetical protein
MAESTNQPKRNKRKKKKGRKSGFIRPFDNSPIGKMRRIFMGCARCSYFLTGYQASQGVTHLQTVVEARGNWLAMNWNQDVRYLLHKSFGGNIDKESTFYSVSCQECRRVYEFNAGISEEEPDSFRVQVNPSGRR